MATSLRSNPLASSSSLKYGEEFLDPSFTLRNTHDSVVHLLLVENRLESVDAQEKKGSQERSALVAVLKRVVHGQEVTVRGRFLVRTSKSLRPKNTHLGLSSARF